MPKWLKAIGKWAGKAIVNALKDEIEKIVDEKKNARTVARKTPKES